MLPPKRPPQHFLGVGPCRVDFLGVVEFIGFLVGKEGIRCLISPL